jgi:hypothetical protein
MRIIEYKKPSSNIFELYVDIGSCEKHYDRLPLFDDEKESYLGWYNNFLILPLGVQLLTIDYYLIEHQNGCCIPDILNEKLKQNFSSLSSLHGLYFKKGKSEFKYLDLEWEDIECEIKNTVLDKKSQTKEIYFNDGSIIKLNISDERVGSLYIPVKDLEVLTSNLSQMLQLIK